MVETDQTAPGYEGPLSTHRARIVYLMRYFSERQVSLKEVAGPGYLNRAVSTLKRYARTYNIAFPDYVPRHMR